MAATVRADGEPLAAKLADLRRRQIGPDVAQIRRGVDAETRRQPREKIRICGIERQQPVQQGTQPRVGARAEVGHVERRPHRAARRPGRRRVEPRLDAKRANRLVDLLDRRLEDRLDAQRRRALTKRAGVVDQVGYHEEDAAQPALQQQRPTTSAHCAKPSSKVRMTELSRTASGPPRRRSSSSYPMKRKVFCR